MTSPTPTPALTPHTPATPSTPLYSPAVWRLIIDDAPHSGAWNMALDEALMETVATGDAPPTLRFYQWRPPCLSLGKRQPLAGVDLAQCAADTVDVVRRATGGWAIFHTDELTYSIVARPDDPRVAGGVLDAYRSLSAGLILGLRSLGADARMNPVAASGAQTASASAACFEAPSAYEITVAERKLIGSAQARPHGRVLQHGSLPLHGDIARVARYLAFTDPTERAALADHLHARATTLSDALARPITFAEAAAALTQGFATALNLTFEPGPPSPTETTLATQRLATKTHL